MNKISKSLKALIAIIKNPWLLNKILSDDSLWMDHLYRKYKMEAGFPLIELEDLFPEFSETIDPFSFLDGGSLPTDIALLKQLCRKFKLESYFEIGTWRGESVANVADVCKECYTLNLSQGEILQMGLSERYATLHGFYSKQKVNIIHLYGNSMQFDFSSLNKRFDLIFIDGDHHYDSVKSDTQKVFQHLVHDESIVVWHDCAYNPEKPRPEVIAGILDGLDAQHHKYVYHVANTLCAIFIRKEFKTSKLELPVTPKYRFNIRIDLERITNRGM